jgi:hypothetical protein
MPRRYSGEVPSQALHYGGRRLVDTGLTFRPIYRLGGVVLIGVPMSI